MTPNDTHLIAKANQEYGAAVEARMLSARLRLQGAGTPRDELERILTSYAAALRLWRSQALAVVVGEVLGYLVDPAVYRAVNARNLGTASFSVDMPPDLSVSMKGAT